MNNLLVNGYNGINTQLIAKNGFENELIVSIDYDIREKIDKIDCKVDLGEFDEFSWSVNCGLAENKTNINFLQNEIKELKKIVANLNTRVNNLIAEKQLKEFYEKNNSDKCVSSVVEKQLVISN